VCVTIVDYNSNLHTGFHDWYTSSISTSFSSCLSFCARLVLSYYPPFAERIGEVFILLHVCCFCLFFLFGQRFLSNPRADSRQILHAGVAWVGTCLLPFWGSAIGKLLSLGDGMQTFTEVIKLIRLCLSISVSSATAERS